MRGDILKTFTVSLISCVLLYYSVAWAVLQCVHSDAHDNFRVILNTGDTLAGSRLSSLNHAHEYLECVGSEYHTELLAGPSVVTELLRRIRGGAAHAGVSLPSSILPHSQAVNFWLSAVFNKPSSTAFPIDLPRYLSLSVLRL
jgi:hypothetical protein